MTYDNEEKFTELADELEAQPNRTNFYTVVIYRLRNNAYHDFKNPDTIPMPKVQMVEDFTRLGRSDVVERIEAGEFDQ